MPTILRQLLHGRAHHKYGTPPEDEERSALAVYLLSGLLGCCGSVLSKLCSAAGLHFFTLTVVRSAVLCCLVAPALARKRINPFAITETFPLLLLRGLCGFSSLSLWYLSLQLIPLSDANSLSFISPVIVAAAAPALLGERTPRAVYCSMPLCLAGMLMVAQPSWLFGAAAGPTSSLGVAAGILQAVFSAGSKLTIRALNKHNEPLESIVFSMGAISTLGATLGCLALPGEQLRAPGDARTWSYLAAMSLIAFVVQLMFTASVRKINASLAASLDYVSLIYTLLADLLVFHKLPSGLGLAGACLISAASLGAILWAQTHPAGAGDSAGAAERAAARPEPLAYKRRHYAALGAAVGSPGGSSEGEAVSLVRAGAAAELSLTAAISAKAAAAAAEAADIKIRPLVCAICAATGAGGATADSGSPARVAAKLALLPDSLTDSSKSWQLGTELEAELAHAPPPAAAGTEAVAQKTGSAAEGGSSLSGFQPEESSGCSQCAAADKPRHKAAISISVRAGGCCELEELVAVAPGGAGAMRTSSEKEQALRAAGK